MTPETARRIVAFVRGLNELEFTTEQNFLTFAREEVLMMAEDDEEEDGSAWDRGYNEGYAEGQLVGYRDRQAEKAHPITNEDPNEFDRIADEPLAPIIVRGLPEWRTETAPIPVDTRFRPPRRVR